MISSRIQFKLNASLNKQRGLTTLAITLLLLVILTLIVLFSTNVAFFEQRTATSENRERLAQQAAEYGLNLAGEYIKAHVSDVSSTQAGGWLEPATLKWARCADATMTANHPCMAERDTARREELYYFSADGSTVNDATSELLDLNGATNSGNFTTVLPAGSIIAKVGGESQLAANTNAEFAMTPRLQALLCRLDVSDPANPQCAADPSPTGGNQIVLTLISQATLGGENAVATIKESWGSVTSFNGAASVPLVAAGTVLGLGNATIVASPDGAGPNKVVSIWSPKNVDIDSSGTGVGSVQTCHRQDYYTESDIKTACAANNACNCAPFAGLQNSEILSGHSASVKVEGKDILDVDGNHAGQDIQFFPGQNAAGVQMDNPAVANDDSLFEWIFGASDATVEGATTTALTCPSTVNAAANTTNDCAITYLIDELGAQVINSCASLSSSSSGLYYVNAATCDLPSQVGNASSSAIVVTRAPTVRMVGTLLYGMLFVHSANNTAELDGTGNTKVFGSVVVEGDVSMHGSIELIYMNTSSNTPGEPLPAGTRFAKVVGSWLDQRRGF